MPQWYSGKIAHQQEQEDGSLKTLTEAYLLQAVSYSDGEARLYQIAEDNGIKEHQIKALTPIRISDVFQHSDGEQWYMAKVVMTSIDDTRGTPKEKRIVSQMAVNADNLKTALERIEVNISKFLVPTVIEGIKLTAYLDIYPESANETENAGTEEN